jgi:hypothetical protein
MEELQEVETRRELLEGQVVVVVLSEGVSLSTIAVP